LFPEEAFENPGAAVDYAGRYSRNERLHVIVWERVRAALMDEGNPVVVAMEKWNKVARLIGNELMGCRDLLWRSSYARPGFASVREESTYWMRQYETLLEDTNAPLLTAMYEKVMNEEVTAYWGKLGIDPESDNVVLPQDLQDVMDDGYRYREDRV
jgi:hypothetical protein